MKTSRRTMEDLDVSRNKIARRWGSGGYGSKFPEEPITNYLDVRIQNTKLLGLLIIYVNSKRKAPFDNYILFFI